MAYVSKGTIQEKRGVWRLSILGEIFSAILSAIHLFISSLWNVNTPATTNRNSNNSSYYQRNQQRRPNTSPSSSSSAPGASTRANIRTFRNLGSANASCGGGG